MLSGVYHVRRKDLPGWIAALTERAVAAMLGILHGDGAPGNWQGSAWTDPARVTTIIAASGVRTRPLRQARDWGYQRLAAGPDASSRSTPPRRRSRGWPGVAAHRRPPSK